MSQHHYKDRSILQLKWIRPLLWAWRSIWLLQGHQKEATHQSEREKAALEYMNQFWDNVPKNLHSVGAWRARIMKKSFRQMIKYLSKIPKRSYRRSYRPRSEQVKTWFLMYIAKINYYAGFLWIFYFVKYIYFRFLVFGKIWIYLIHQKSRLYLQIKYIRGISTWWSYLI